MRDASINDPTLKNQLNNMEIIKGDLNDDENFYVIPCQVTIKSKENIEVAYGEGKVLIKNFEVDGKIINQTQIIKSIRTRLK